MRRERVGVLAWMWNDFVVRRYRPGCFFFLFGCIYESGVQAHNPRARCIYVWHQHVNNSSSTSCLNYWCLKEYRNRQQKNSSLEGEGMMQDVEKNYDFVIIYSFSLQNELFTKMKNVMSNQIKENIYISICIAAMKIKLMVYYVLLLVRSNLWSNNIVDNKKTQMCGLHWCVYGWKQLNFSATIWCITVKLCTDSHGPQRMNPRKTLVTPWLFSLVSSGGL